MFICNLWIMIYYYSDDIIKQSQDHCPNALPFIQENCIFFSAYLQSMFFPFSAGVWRKGKMYCLPMGTVWVKWQTVSRQSDKPELILWLLPTKKIKSTVSSSIRKYDRRMKSFCQYHSKKQLFCFLGGSDSKRNWDDEEFSVRRLWLFRQLQPPRQANKMYQLHPRDSGRSYCTGTVD